MGGGCYGFEKRIITPKPLYQGDIIFYLHMDWTDDLENSPEPTNKAKPDEVQIIIDEIKDDKEEKPYVKKDPPPSWKDKKNDDYNEYEYSDDKEIDDNLW